MTDKLTFIIPGKPEYITMVRLAIGSVANTAGFDIEEIDDIRTAVAEACRNISCHGSEGFAEEYQVECLVDGGKLEISVKDMSSDHKIKKVNKPCLDCPNEGNLGVFVIQSLMTRVEILDNTQGKKTIKMVKER